MPLYNYIRYNIKYNLKKRKIVSKSNLIFVFYINSLIL